MLSKESVKPPSISTQLLQKELSDVKKIKKQPKIAKETGYSAQILVKFPVLAWA